MPITRLELENARMMDKNAQMAIRNTDPVYGRDSNPATAGTFARWAAHWALELFPELREIAVDQHVNLQSLLTQSHEAILVIQEERKRLQ